MVPKIGFKPAWHERIPPAKSYRSLFTWGRSDVFKHPNKRLYKLMKKTFGLSDDDFAAPLAEGFNDVDYDRPPALSPEQLDGLREIVGPDNVSIDNYERLRVAYGKTMIDLMRLREGVVENIPDAVVYPRDRRDVQALVALCNAHGIAVYVFGGGSSVTRGAECVKGGISLDMAAHMNRINALNETNHTVTVEAGISGPALEGALNDAVNRLGAKRNYTCGHLPQSFEFSTVGGWVVTRGAGQNSTYYGKIEHLVVCQEYVTPAGTIRTHEYPAFATGPSIDQIMIGSEGAFGVLVSVTLKVFRHMPDTTRRFSYLFKSWDDATAAARELLQSQCGYPSVFRLSDPDETDVVMKLYGVEGTPIDWLVRARGFKPGTRCLLLGSADGDAAYTRMVARKVRAVARRHGAMSATAHVTRKWEHGRYTDPYLRDDLLDYGIVVDTLECAVSWERLNAVYESVRAFCRTRPRTIIMSHMSHFYPQGTNLYFIFIGKMGREEYLSYQRGILDAIQKSGAAMSHHHGIGKMFAPWLAGQIGKYELDIFKALKRHFDPHNIMNPGGTLALDMDEREMVFAAGDATDTPQPPAQTPS